MLDKNRMLPLTGLATAEEVCRYLGISRRTLTRLLSSGRLTGYKIGGVWRFSPKDLEAYLAACRRQLGRVFYPTVLQKYFDQPKKYQITKKGPQGWLRIRPEYLLGLSEDERVRESFEPVKYEKTRTALGLSMITVMPKYFNRLPAEEQQYWARFEIS